MKELDFLLLVQVYLLLHMDIVPMDIHMLTMLYVLLLLSYLVERKEVFKQNLLGTKGW